MTMVSMKTGGDYCEAMSSEYGYGTRISLNDEQCEALGITGAPPAGMVFTLTARAVAQSVTQSVEGADEAGEGGKPDVRMELQITDMALTPESGKSIANTLYGE